MSKISILAPVLLKHPVVLSPTLATLTKSCQVRAKSEVITELIWQVCVDGQVMFFKMLEEFVSKFKRRYLGRTFVKVKIILVEALRETIARRTIYCVIWQNIF
jgi:hypothetical protein